MAAALGLRRAGWHVQVLERRTASAAAAQPGSGISLWPNGIRALAALGVGQQVVDGAARSGRNGVRTAAARWIARGRRVPRGPGQRATALTWSANGAMRESATQRAAWAG
jgi:2-polyprenyl-6-methoxyphenol hydroxylase-like FAD-dependent oxidoreductase